MYDVEETNVLATDQYGSRKHHEAICACLNKVLFNNMLRINKNAGAMGCNDDKRCYNRINKQEFLLITHLKGRRLRY